MPKGYDLPLHVAEAVKRETGEETVLWVGQPDPAAIFWSATSIWFFAVPWTAFTLFWEAIAVGGVVSAWLFAADKSSMSKLGSLVMLLWGLPFLGIGIAMMSAPWWAARVSRNTAFVVTPRYLRTIVAWPGGKLKAQKSNVSRVISTSRTEGKDGFGDLKISRGRIRDSEGDFVEDADTWSGIPDVRRVEDIIAELIEPRWPGTTAA